MIQSHNKVFLFVKVAGFLQELRAACERERAGQKTKRTSLCFTLNVSCICHNSQLAWASHKHSELMKIAPLLSRTSLVIRGQLEVPNGTETDPVTTDMPVSLKMKQSLTGSFVISS